ncbi:MAG: hypothetical protein ACTSV1_10435 [Alphaproteobacteria bacterium]
MAKNSAKLPIVFFMAALLVMLMGGGNALAAHPSTPWLEPPPGNIAEDHDHGDDIRIAHDYMVSGLGLRGPLNDICERIEEIERDGDGRVPSIRVTYLSTSLNGDALSMTIDSFSELKRVLAERREVRGALAEEIANLGAMSLDTEYTVSPDGCEAGGLQPGVAATDRIGLDYGLRIGATEAVIVPFDGTALLLTLGERPMMMFGHIDDGVITLEQVQGTCSVKLIPTGGENWGY